MLWCNCLLVLDIIFCLRWLDERALYIYFWIWDGAVNLSWFGYCSVWVDHQILRVIFMIEFACSWLIFIVYSWYICLICLDQRTLYILFFDLIWRSSIISGYAFESYSWLILFVWISDALMFFFYFFT